MPFSLILSCFPTSTPFDCGLDLPVMLLIVEGSQRGWESGLRVIAKHVEAMPAKDGEGIEIPLGDEKTGNVLVFETKPLMQVQLGVSHYSPLRLFRGYQDPPLP